MDITEEEDFKKDEDKRNDLLEQSANGSNEPAKGAKRFGAWGIILIVFAVAIAMGLFFWRAKEMSDKERTPEETLMAFGSAINQRDLQLAQNMLSSKKDGLIISEPTNQLGMIIYENFSIISIKNITELDNNRIMADVTLKTLDTQKIMSRAIFELITKLGAYSSDNYPDSAQQDEMLNEIYDTILVKENLPEREILLIVTLEKEKDGWKIVPDEALKNAFEGNMEENLYYIKSLMQVDGTALPANP